MPNPKTAFLPSIQVGRGIAVLLVLLYHVSEALAGPGSYAFVAGAAGVDIFFVISGFIIVYVSRRDSARAFILKRMIRVIPLYYAYTTLVVSILVLAPTFYANLRFDWSFIICSYLLILSPSNTGAPGVAVGVGWTLCYESYFYVLMALGILFFRDRGWLFPVSVIIAGAAISPFVEPPAPLIPAFTALSLEFVAGVLIAELHLRHYRLSPPIVWTAILGGLAVIIYGGAIHAVGGLFYDPARVLWYGGPAVAIVAALTSLHSESLVMRPLSYLGNISYSLYLSHPFVVAAAIRLLKPFGLPPVPAGVAIIGMTIAAATVCYRLFEAPSTRFLSQRWKVRNPVPSARSN